jgi:hypothetical protein
MLNGKRDANEVTRRLAKEALAKRFAPVSLMSQANAGLNFFKKRNTFFFFWDMFTQGKIKRRFKLITSVL